MDKINILDTDRFYQDSPNIGEPDCTCSRCYRQIQEGEKLLRIAVDRELIYLKNKDGIEVPKMVDSADGTEFRLCQDCIKNLK